MIQAELVTEAGTHKAAGTIFGQNMPRLVQLGEYRLEAFLDGVLMIFTHRDVPGIIGRVGTIFGKHKVNIAQMAVGRASHQPGGEAIGVLNLDHPAASGGRLKKSPLRHIRHGQRASSCLPPGSCRTGSSVRRRSRPNSRRRRSAAWRASRVSAASASQPRITVQTGAGADQ